MSTQLFLGRPAFDPKPFTRVDPVALAEAGAWRVYGDWSKALPTEGRAFAPRLASFSSQSLVAFGVEPNTKSDNERDRFVVANPREVCQVLDFRKQDAEAARRRLVEIGQPRLVGGSKSVVAALAGGQCVVVRMVPHPSRDVWVADISGLENLPTHVFDERLFEGDQVDGGWFTVPGCTVGEVMGGVNWCRDSDFLGSVLKRLRKPGQQAPGAPSRPQIAQIVAQLDRENLLPTNGADFEPMRDRLRTFAPLLGKNIRAVDEIIEILGALTPVQERLAAELSEKRAALEGEMRRELEDKLLSELDASLTELTQERDRLAQEVVTLATDIKGKRAELNEELRSLEKARAALGGDLTQLLGELGEQPLPADADIARLGGLLAAKLGEPGAAFEVAVQGGPPWTIPRRAVDEPKAWDEFDRILKATALRWGYIAEDLRVADAAVRGGNLVLLPDEHASGFVSCYADLVAGGGYRRHVLDPSIISLDDLWRLPGSGRHGCLARTWAAAKVDPRGFQVLLLEGLHRTPSALWMSSLLDVLRDPRRPRNLLVFASLGSPSIDADRDWRGPSEAVLALAPTRTANLPPGLLARAVGAAQPATRFDAAQAPAPTASEVMSFVSALEGSAPTGVLQVACDVYRAAWPFGADCAASLGLAVARPDSQAPSGLTAGAAWLRARQQDKD